MFPASQKARLTSETNRGHASLSGGVCECLNRTGFSPVYPRGSGERATVATAAGEEERFMTVDGVSDSGSQRQKSLMAGGRPTEGRHGTGRDGTGHAATSLSRGGGGGGKVPFTALLLPSLLPVVEFLHFFGSARAPPPSAEGACD